MSTFDDVAASVMAQVKTPAPLRHETVVKPPVVAAAAQNRDALKREKRTKTAGGKTAVVSQARSRKSVLGFPEDRAAKPTEMARMGIVSSELGTRQRKVFSDEEMPSDPCMRVLYSGPEIDEHDEHAWLGILRLYRNTPLGDICEFRLSDLMADINMKRTGRNYKVIRERLIRLAKVVLDITVTRKGKKLRVVTSLMSCSDYNDGEVSWVSISPKAAAFFDCLAYQDWELRKRLRRSMSRLLYGYVCSHRVGRAVSVGVDELKSVFRYEGRSNDFNSRLKKAFVELKGQNVVEDYSITRGSNGRAVWVRAK